MCETWHGCYDGNWNWLITPESFSHPAKMARGLTDRIFDYAFERGWLRRGDVCVDPFGGIGSTGIIGASRGVKVLCCELEQRFVDLAKANFELHRRTWEACGDPLPVMVNGDSRRLCEVLGPVLAECVVSSPPFADSVFSERQAKLRATWNEDPANANRPGFRPNQTGEYSSTSLSLGEYGTTPGQLGAMPAGSVDACIGSPPWLNDHDAEKRGEKLLVDASVKHRHKTRLVDGSAKDYGTTDGQLAAMPTGSVDAVVSSPPFCESSGGGGDQRGHLEHKRYVSEGHGAIKDHGADRYYGETEGQLGRLPTGSVDSIISSPPYSSGVVHGGSGIDQDALSGNTTGVRSQARTMDGYGCSDGNLGNLRPGDVSAVISSPPFSEDHPRQTKLKDGWEGKGGDGFLHGQGFAKTDGNLAAMRPGDVADCIVSSPPYEGNRFDGGEESLKKPQGRCKGYSRDGGYADNSDGQLGNETGITFWEAARIICKQCFQILRPGGVAIWVCKDFVRNKQRVPFSADWQRLCIACGFEPVEWIKASLVKEQRHPGLFGDEIVERTERKGFFRRLAEKKGSPPIDEEDVLILRKPSPKQLELIP